MRRSFRAGSTFRISVPAQANQRGVRRAGAVLALLLVRQGISVTLLEAHEDFDREFRGDTVHPSTLEILDEIGLAERLHQFRHVKITTPTFRVGESSFTPIDLRRLKTRFPYVMLMHQPVFLEFVTEEAAKYPNFRLVMQANVMALIEEGGEVQGVRASLARSEGAAHGWCGRSFLAGRLMMLPSGEPSH